jgi:hypothetical protein
MHLGQDSFRCKVNSETVDTSFAIVECLPRFRLSVVEKGPD